MSCKDAAWLARQPPPQKRPEKACSAASSCARTLTKQPAPSIVPSSAPSPPLPLPSPPPPRAACSVENSYFFSSFHYQIISDAELESKPTVLLVGQYSTGKTTFISHLLGRDYYSAHIGPEPTTDKFVAVVHGKEDKVIKGNSLTVVPELPFGGLATFGGAFLNKFEASVCPAELLQSVTIIDTPGVLSGEKQRIARAYDFADVVRWLAERSDLILLLFDAHKLDISDEFRDVINALAPHDDKVRCILNKADQISRDQLVRVYGSLMWSMGKIFKTPEVARVYVGSYWDKVRRVLEENLSPSTFPLN